MQQCYFDSYHYYNKCQCFIWRARCQGKHTHRKRTPAVKLFFSGCTDETTRRAVKGEKLVIMRCMRSACRYSNGVLSTRLYVYPSHCGQKGPGIAICMRKVMLLSCFSCPTYAFACRSVCFLMNSKHPYLRPIKSASGNATRRQSYQYQRLGLCSVRR